jgi:hypothetical protein
MSHERGLQVVPPTFLREPAIGLLRDVQSRRNISKVVLTILALYLFGLSSLWSPVHGQHAGAFKGSLDDPAIAYATGQVDNAVDEVNRQLRDSALRFTFNGRSGFLRSALDALRLPVDSQLLVFSRGSLQGKRIGEQNPRAIYFNDRVALGWVRDGDVLEVAAHDAHQGVVFYTLDQRADATAPPQFKRSFICLGCHVTGDSLGVPGLLMFSTTRPGLGEFDGVPRHIDQSDQLERRFGGWFVTGHAGTVRHMGNNASVLDGLPTRELASVDHLFDNDGYPALTSDIVAHLVLTHQVGMTNLLTRASFEARVAQGDPSAIAAVMDAVAQEVVDHLLFVDEITLPAPIEGNSGFAERFSASGPKDRKGRSLYQLDLKRRLFKYRCSYLIYSPAFDTLPAHIKSRLYRRMWAVMSTWPRETRQPIVEILLDTKKDLPPDFTEPPPSRSAP